MKNQELQNQRNNCINYIMLDGKKYPITNFRFIDTETDIFSQITCSFERNPKARIEIEVELCNKY